MSTRARGRPRREGADEAILNAARALFDETGYAAFNVDALAERTGIAKTTIYRRWPTKGALIAAAIGEIEDTEQLLAKLRGADLDVLRAVLAPRRERLLASLGPRADEVLGAMLLRAVLDLP